MLELVSVELTNFRSFAHATFDPLGMGQGMTAINGPNGSGKSTITHAICWALYGITPDGVPVRALRKQGSEGEVRASVTFAHEGQTIIVSRALRGRNDSTIASITVNGIEETSVSTKTATAWVVNRLGLDAEAFLTAFVVRQKELDSLVKARPAERRKAIERLAGIERMSLALEIARANAKQAQRILDALPQGEDVETAQAKYDESLSTLEEMANKISLIEDQEQTAENNLLQAQTLFNQAQKAINDSKIAEHKLELAEQSVLSLQRETERLEQEALGAETLTYVIGLAEKARNDYTIADQATRAVTSFIAKSEADNERLLLAEAELNEARTSLKGLKQVEHDIIEELMAFPENLDTQNDFLLEQIKDLTQEKGALKGEWDRLSKAIGTLKASTFEHAECPTCLKPLEDADLLITSLEESLTRVQKSGEDLANKIKLKEAELSNINKNKSLRLGLLNKQSGNQQALSLADALILRAQENEARMADIAETSAEEAHEAKLAAQTASESLPKLRLAESNAQEELRKVETAVKAAKELPGAQVKLDHAIKAMGIAQAELDIAQEISSVLDLEVIEDEVTNASMALRLVMENSAQTKADHSFTIKSVEVSRLALEIAENSAVRRHMAISEWERQSALALALDEFRRDRLSRLAPELSEVASDLISRMTDNKYTTVELDEDFTPILTDATGAQRPVAWLSGGEESTVALALRVAIGEVLAGQRGGLLILDEVLTAQDTFRRQATMAAIRALPRQIITINHVSEATDMVDLVAEVVDDGEGGSTIVDSSPADSLGSNISDEALNA